MTDTLVAQVRHVKSYWPAIILSKDLFNSCIFDDQANIKKKANKSQGLFPCAFLQIVHFPGASCKNPFGLHRHGVINRPQSDWTPRNLFSYRKYMYWLKKVIEQKQNG